MVEMRVQVWLAEPLPAELRRQLSFGLPPDASAKVGASISSTARKDGML